MQAGQRIDASVGLEMERKIGENVHQGDVLVKIMCDNIPKAEAARELVVQAIALEDQPVERFALWQVFEASA
jgi:thymidine phosphorylase